MQALGVDIQTIQSIVGHADTEMTEHDLHVQESIRQSAVQLFSEAFFGLKIGRNGTNYREPAFKSLASTLARISQQMMLRQKSPLAPAIDQIKSLALWSKLWSKPMRPAYKQKSPTISNVKSLDLWSSRAGQIRTFSSAASAVKRPQNGRFGCHPCN